MTAGPTQEPIDPVRFISNHSSGKMGIAIAEALADAGAEVTLILGPADQKVSNASIAIESITTAQEMLQMCKKHIDSTDFFIAAAAVADYAPAETAHQKIKKSAENLSISLIKTPDILKEISLNKHNSQIMIGFALESENEVANAQKKIVEKNLDFIILNSINEEGAGFKHDTNKITIIDKNNNFTKFELKPKKKVAQDIVDYIIKYTHA